MFVDDSVDAQYTVLCTEILEPTLKKIALTLSVSTTDFYNAVHELTFKPERLMSDQATKLGVDLDFEDIQGYDRMLEIEKSKQRLYRIAKRLTLNPDEDRKLNRNILVEPKIYDGHLHDAMAMTYSTISNMIGDSLFNKLERTRVVRALQLEERKECMNDKAHISFSEFTMFTCLYMALNRASVDALNKNTETANYRKRLKGRLRQIKKWLFSEQLRDVLVRTILDLLVEFNKDQYRLLLDKHCREYWLPEEKRHIKYLDYAEKQKYFLHAPRIVYQGKQLLRDNDSSKEENVEGIPLVKLLCNRYQCDEEECIESFMFENDQLQMYQEFFFNVLPVITMISENFVPKGIVQMDETIKQVNLQPYLINADKLDRITKEHIKRQKAQEYTVCSKTYQIAERVCGVIDTYVDAVICSVGRFLECLPESNVRGTKTLLEYLESI